MSLPEKIYTLLGIVITWLAIFFIVPVMGFDIKMWVLIVTASIGGLFAGFMVILGEPVIENIFVIIVMLVIAAVVSGEVEGLRFVFISVLLSGVIGTIANQACQYTADKARSR